MPDDLVPQVMHLERANATLAILEGQARVRRDELALVKVTGRQEIVLRAAAQKYWGRVVPVRRRHRTRKESHAGL
jgi:hypothetical protein